MVWRWGIVEGAAIVLLPLGWAVINDFGVFTYASASLVDAYFLSVRPPRSLCQRRSLSRDNLLKLLQRTARTLGAREVWESRLSAGAGAGAAGAASADASRSRKLFPRRGRRGPHAQVT